MGRLPEPVHKPARSSNFQVFETTRNVTFGGDR